MIVRDNQQLEESSRTCVHRYLMHVKARLSAQTAILTASVCRRAVDAERKK